MLNAPRKTKFKKAQKGSLPNRLISNAKSLTFGAFGIKSLSFGVVTNSQLEASRKIIQKKLKKSGKLWVNVFTHTPKSKKPVEVRMGKGKGSVNTWVVKIKPGIFLFEFECGSNTLAAEIESSIKNKLPINCRLICF